MKRLVTLFLISLICSNLFAQKIACNDDPFLKRCIKERIVAAKHGNEEMQSFIGSCCLFGLYVEQDTELGLRYINLAEQSHYAVAYEVHGDFLSKSNSSLAKEKYELAIQYYNPNDQFPVDTNRLIKKIDYLPFGGFTQAAYDNFRKTEKFFLSGDYDSCSEIGDSILINNDKVSNIHDALSLSYSSLADREKMFSLSRYKNNSFPIYGRYRTREMLKADKALDYFSGLEIDTELFLYNGQYSTILMKILQSTIDCSKITNSNTYELLI